jgi:Protein of unknown function (DUF2934)
MATRRTTGSARTTGTAPAQPTEKGAPRRRVAPVKAGAEPSTVGVATSAATAAASTGITVSEDARRAMIAQAAYLRGERRGFTAGGETEDWLAAEAEVDALLRAGNGGPPQ